MDVRDKVVAITGAARGLGQEFARSLAAAGARVVAADINDCAATLELVHAQGGNGIAVRLDVTDAGSAHAMVAAGLEAFGRVDALINNAALYGALAHAAAWDSAAADEKPKHLAALLADPASTLLIAKEGAAIVGTATVIVYTSPAWVKARIEDVVVDQSARGRGVGEALVRACLSVARKRGASVAELQSARRREAANRLYPRMGFELRETNVYRITLV